MEMGFACKTQQRKQSHCRHEKSWECRLSWVQHEIVKGKKYTYIYMRVYKSQIVYFQFPLVYKP